MAHKCSYFFLFTWYLLVNLYYFQRTTRRLFSVCGCFFRQVIGVCSIRIFAKNMGDPYYEPTIMVNDRVRNPKTWKFTNWFLYHGGNQRVVINGSNSTWAPSLSGVPQALLWDHLNLFILYANDIPDLIQGYIRMLADESWPIDLPDVTQWSQTLDLFYLDDKLNHRSGIWLMSAAANWKLSSFTLYSIKQSTEVDVAHEEKYLEFGVWMIWNHLFTAREQQPRQYKYLDWLRDSLASKIGYF